jgi:lysophospholipase L1-like esterase
MAQQETGSRTVTLLGDSIRIGYAPYVVQRLQGEALVVSPTVNGGDTRRTLANLHEWAVAHRPHVVHFNCGLHDCRRDVATGAYQVDLAEYESNLRRIVQRLHEETDAALVFATTTPVVETRHTVNVRRRGLSFERTVETIQRYNAIALEVMREAGASIDDLYLVVDRAGPDQLLGEDGVHFTPQGYAILAGAVATSIATLLEAPERHSSSPGGGGAVPTE